MWVVRGPFDGDEGQDPSPESESVALVHRIPSANCHLESKLLKPGKRYVLGRKGVELLIPSKKISREHVTFTLSEFPTSRVVSQIYHLLSRFILIWFRTIQRSNRRHDCKTHATSLSRYKGESIS